MIQKSNLTFRVSAFAICVLISVALVSPAVGAQSYLYNRADFPTGNGPSAVIIADFNRDGKLDIAAANFNDNTVSILLGTPGGTFATKVDYATGTSPAALVAADFNGDRKLDLAVLDESADTVSILLGNGDGTFQSKVDYGTGNNPVGIVAADFNGDKKIDLAVLNENDNTVSILLGNGDGSFQGQTAVAVGTTPTSLANGDFNGDHKTDLITSNIGTGTVTVLLSKGNGTFTRLDSPSGLLPGPNFSTLAVGDFNSDGKLDVVTSSQDSQLFLLLGKGNGTFQPPVNVPITSGISIRPMLAGDFNHDGKLDLACGNSIAAGGIDVLLGNGDGTFHQPIVSPLGGSTFSLATADLNGDGQLDLVATNQNLASVDILLGNGKGTFGSMKTVTLAPSVYGPDSAVVADFNGDGKLDLAVAEINFPNGQVSVELGNGNGTFQKPIASPLSTSAVNANFMASGDFNGDGKVDLLVLDSYRTGFQVLLGNGDGTFETPVDTTVNSGVGNLAVGDFNGDGKADLAVITNAGFNSSLQIYLSKGDGTFSLGAQYAVSGGVIAAEVNHDGKMDLVLSSFGSPLQVLLGKGDGTFTSPMSGPSDTFSGDMVAMDFNGDGKLDLAVGTYSGIAFLAGNEDGTFQAPVHSNSVFGFSGRLVASDFNGDGKLDLVSSPPFNTTLSGAVVMVGNGDGTFQAPMSYGVAGVFPNPIVAGDFNSDGVSDFAIPSEATNGSNGTALSLHLSAPALNLFPATLNFGKQLVGATSKPRASTLTNVGNSRLSVNGVGVSGDYQLTQSCSGKIAIGDNCSVDATFTPTQIGTRTGSITIKDNVVTSPQLIDLTGIGASTAHLSPTSLSFSSQAIGTKSAPKEVTLKNVGTTILTITSIAVAGSNPGDFAQTHNCGSSLAAGASCTISVTFKPTVSGRRTAVVSVTDNAAGSPQKVTLSGIGTTAKLSPTGLSFGSVAVGTTSAAKTVTLTNVGTTALTITGIAITGTNAGDFTQTHTCGSSLAAAASCTVSVKFKPTATGTRSAALSISDNAAGSPQKVALSGTGT